MLNHMEESPNPVKHFPPSAQPMPSGSAIPSLETSLTPSTNQILPYLSPYLTSAYGYPVHPMLTLNGPAGFFSNFPTIPPNPLTEPQTRPTENAAATAAAPVESGTNQSASNAVDAKRYRTTYTPFQSRLLEEAFQSNHYITRPIRTQLSKTLGLPENTIKVWFQNRRMKEKRQSMMLPNIASRDPQLRNTLLEIANLYERMKYSGQNSNALEGNFGFANEGSSADLIPWGGVATATAKTEADVSQSASSPSPLPLHASSFSSTNDSPVSASKSKTRSIFAVENLLPEPNLHICEEMHSTPDKKIKGGGS